MSLKVIPLATKIITSDDPLPEIIAAYAGPSLQKGDILVVAESVVAISQGRLIRPEQIRPNVWALMLARFVSQDGSLSSPYAMQVIMNESGFIRTALSFCAAAISHLLLGRRGDFYRLAGQQASLVDDITGNMPPFDKHIVLGPSHPEQVVADIKSRFGIEAAIIDANDLGRTKILAATPGVSRPLLLRVFSNNPAGNSDQQTPLVIIRKVKT